MALQLPPGSSYGKILKRSTAAAFVLSEISFPPGRRLPRHAHDSVAFYLVLEGAYSEIYSRRTVAPEPLTLAYMPAGETHWHHGHDVGSRLFVLNLDPRKLENLGAGMLTRIGAGGLHGPLLTGLALRLYREFREPDDMAPLAMQGLVLELLAEASRSSRHVAERCPPPWLSQARELLHARFADSLTLDEIAASVAVHPGHLASMFRRHHRCTIGEYLRRLRVEFVCRELTRGNAPLADLALTAGFADQSHLTRTFKRMTGVTPAQYRAAVHPTRLRSRY